MKFTGNFNSVEIETYPDSQTITILMDGKKGNQNYKVELNLWGTNQKEPESIGKNWSVFKEGFYFSSESIDKVYYCASSCVLGVQFKSNLDTMYMYSNIKVDEFVRFIQSDSLNRYWRDNFKGMEGFTKVEYREFINNR